MEEFFKITKIDKGGAEIGKPDSQPTSTLENPDSTTEKQLRLLQTWDFFHKMTAPSEPLYSPSGRPLRQVSKKQHHEYQETESLEDSEDEYVPPRYVEQAKNNKKAKRKRPSKTSEDSSDSLPSKKKMSGQCKQRSKTPTDRKLPANNSMDGSATPTARRQLMSQKSDSSESMGFGALASTYSPSSLNSFDGAFSTGNGDKANFITTTTSDTMLSKHHESQPQSLSNASEADVPKILDFKDLLNSEFEAVQFGSELAHGESTDGKLSEPEFSNQGSVDAGLRPVTVSVDSSGTLLWEAEDENVGHADPTSTIKALNSMAATTIIATTSEQAMRFPVQNIIPLDSDINPMKTGSGADLAGPAVNESTDVRLEVNPAVAAITETTTVVPTTGNLTVGPLPAATVPIITKAISIEPTTAAQGRPMVYIDRPETTIGQIQLAPGPHVPAHAIVRSPAQTINMTRSIPPHRGRAPGPPRVSSSPVVVRTPHFSPQPSPRALGAVSPRGLTPRGMSPRGTPRSPAQRGQMPLRQVVLRGALLQPDSLRHPWYSRFGILTQPGFWMQFTHYGLSFLKPEKIRDGCSRSIRDPAFDLSTLTIPPSFLHRSNKILKQWWKAKSKHFDTIFFFKVDDRYHVYHMDAVIVALQFTIPYEPCEGHALLRIPEINYRAFADALMRQQYKVAQIHFRDKRRVSQPRAQSLPRTPARRSAQKVVTGTVDLTNSDDDEVQEIQSDEPEVSVVEEASPGEQAQEAPRSSSPAGQSTCSSLSSGQADVTQAARLTLAPTTLPLQQAQPEAMTLQATAEEAVSVAEGSSPSEEAETNNHS